MQAFFDCHLRSIGYTFYHPVNIKNSAVQHVFVALRFDSFINYRFTCTAPTPSLYVVQTNLSLQHCILIISDQPVVPQSPFLGGVGPEMSPYIAPLSATTLRGIHQFFLRQFQQHWQSSILCLFCAASPHILLSLLSTFFC